MIKYSILFFVFLFSCRQVPEAPPLKNNFHSLTTHQEIKNYLKSISSDNIEIEEIGKSHTARELYLLKISSSKFGKDTSKIKIMIFAQQHGNEQSGKEAMLLMIDDLLNGKFSELLSRVDILLVPQVNPDGNDANLRRNANDVDLNRNHLILTENETKILHDVFNKHLPEVTIDIHEYYPYSKSWNEYGYLKYWNDQLGTVTNINIDSSIIKLQKEELMPFVSEYVTSQGFSFNEYVLGGPPNKRRMRYSTVDISDGRQSFGILNTFSLIIEGRRGKDSLTNLERTR
jgi:hypothetical protein